MTRFRRLGYAHYYVSLIAIGSYFVAVLSFLKIYYVAVLFAAWISVLIARTVLGDPASFVRDTARIVLIFVYLAITSIWADDPQRTLVAVATDSIYIGVWLVAYVLARGNDEFRLSSLFIALPYVIAGVYVYLLVRYGTVRPVDDETLRAMGAVANVASITLAICLPFLVWRASNGGIARIVELTLVYLLIGISQSRAGFILAFVCTCLSLVASLRGAPSRIVKVTLQLFLALIASMMITMIVPEFRAATQTAVLRTIDSVPDLINASDPSGDDTPRASRVSERDAMLSVGWSAFLENPFFGIGYHNLGPRVEQQYGIEVVSHNLLLTFVVECGWPALLILSYVVLGALARLARNIRRQPGPVVGFYQACLIAIIAMFLVSMAHQVHQFQMLYIVLAFAYAAPNPRRSTEGYTTAGPRDA